MVFVHPSRQRTGVGTALLGHVFGVARSRSSNCISVWTGIDNPVAERFYSSLRMKRTGARAPGARSEQMEFSLSLSVPGGTSLQAIAGSTRSTAARPRYSSTT
jgi:hypothetical protein